MIVARTREVGQSSQAEFLQSREVLHRFSGISYSIVRILNTIPRLSERPLRSIPDATIGIGVKGQTMFG